MRMKLADLENKKILLVGYGKEGKATEEFLKKMVLSSSISIADKIQGDEYLAKQENYDIALKSPGVKADVLKIPYTTATNLFFELVKGKTIGVTGTKGKSTTASIIAHILKAAGKRVHLVGNIGNPMLSELLVSNTPDDIWVIELSSFQLVDITYSPDIAVLVSLFPEHMNYHGSVAAYYQAKARIIEFATEKNTVVYNADYPEITELLEETKAIRIPFIPLLPFPDSVMKLEGKHNKDNMRGAVTVAQLLGISDSITEKAISAFFPLKHRLQNIGTFQGITFYDDAISTTPQSTIAALEALDKVGTIFLGGEDRGYDFTPLIEELLKKQIPNLVFFPESGKTIEKLLQSHKEYQPKTLATSSMQEAISFTYANTPKNTICLLSCASPSYSIWKNFEVKGDEFQKIVTQLGK